MVGKLQSLSDISEGEKGIVQRIVGGRTFNNRLLVLGFTVGSEVLVKQKPKFGPLIVLIRDSRIALGRGEAAKILVEVEKPSSAA